MIYNYDQLKKQITDHLSPNTPIDDIELLWKDIILPNVSGLVGIIETQSEQIDEFNYWNKLD
jgi:hypothetical protein